MPPFSPLLLAAALLVTGPVHAAPFAITYTGTTAPPFASHTPLPDIVTGESYTVTLVFDNGGTTASSQTWTGAHLRCVFFHLNDARNLVYAQDLVAEPPSEVIGSTSTNAGGALVNIYIAVDGYETPSTHYTTRGFTLAPGGANWQARDQPLVFADNVNAFMDASASGGIPMTVAHWSAPQPFDGPCDANYRPDSVSAVPALGGPALALLGAGATGLAARRLRRRS